MEGKRTNMFEFLLVVCGALIVSCDAIKYTSTKLVEETLTSYENSRIHLQIRGKGNDTSAFMKIVRPIERIDNFRVNAVAVRHDGIEFTIPRNPIALCDLLEEESRIGGEPALKELHLSRIFNLDGEICPIRKSTKRLVPYLLPRVIHLANDIGCGKFNLTTTIETCKDKKFKTCDPIITANTEISLEAKKCSNKLM